ncbi:MAG: hypothetical protein ABJQ70_03520 [Roseobacter sp.]
MPEHESVRSTAEAVGRITCIKTGEEIGLLYRWDNGETQASLHDAGHPVSPQCSHNPVEPGIGGKNS